ncbi:replication protein [Escherichia coli]|nr:replication protein [Escherichia coli]
MVKAKNMPNPMPKTKANNEPYRKVKITIWDDPKFRALSPLPPSGQSLFIYLLTSPFTGIIPGLFKAGRAAMAEELGWDIEAFDLALGEAMNLGMVKADIKARVFWLPNAAKHNPPNSINVIKSWAKAFALIPDCPLKWEARESLRAASYGVSEALGMAFDKAIPLPEDKPKDKANALSCGIQITDNRYINPTHNARVRESAPASEANGVPLQTAEPDYLEGLNEPIGKFPMTDGWHPSLDFRRRAALWGVALPEPEFTPAELAAFRDYWAAEGKVFTQVQWEQKFARHVNHVRAQVKPVSKGVNHAAAPGGTASRAVQEIRAAREQWERENGFISDGNGVEVVGTHGGGLFEPLDPEERGRTFEALDCTDWCDD